jgi:hypothetical protein
MPKIKKALSGLIISFLATSLLAVTPANAATRAQPFKPARAGRISTAASNTILNGVTPPKSSDGIEGDFYIDTKSMFFYGPKTKTHWPSPTSIRGPQGQSGPSGSNGSDARPSANVVAAGAQGLTGGTGPKGEQGAQGAQGMAGPSGSKGDAGVTGLAGSSGAPGTSGASGATGAQGPAGPQGGSGNSGANGSVGPAGSPGSVGPSGSAGATGPSGATGPAGLSNVYVISIPIWNLSTATGGTGVDSLQFGSLAANKSYRFSIIVHGVTTATNSYFGTSVKSGPLSVPTIFESAVFENIAYVGSTFSHRYTFIIEGTVVIGSSDSWLKVNVVDGGGATSGGNQMSLSGQAIVHLVGQVTQTS